MRTVITENAIDVASEALRFSKAKILPALRIPKRRSAKKRCVIADAFRYRACTNATCHGDDPIHALEHGKIELDPAWPGVEEWLAETIPKVARLVASLIAVLDPQAIVFGGQLPRARGQMMIERVHMPSQREHRYGVGPKEAKLVLGGTEGDLAALGAALLPLSMGYFT